MYKSFNPCAFTFLGVVVLSALALTNCPTEIVQTGTTIKNFQVDITDPAGQKATFYGVVDKTKYTIDIIVDDERTKNAASLAVYDAARAAADAAGTFPLKPTFDTSANSRVKARSGATVDFITKKAIYTITSANGKKQNYTAYLGKKEDIDALTDADQTIKYITGNRITDFVVNQPWGTGTTGLGELGLKLGVGQVLEDFKAFKPRSASDQAIVESIKAWRIVAFVDDSDTPDGEQYRKLFDAAKAKNQKDVDAGRANVSLLSDDQLKMQVINSLHTKFSIPENASVNPLPGTPQKFYVENKSSTSRYGIQAEIDALEAEEPAPVTDEGNAGATTWAPYGVPYRVTSQTGETLEYRIWIIPLSDSAAWWGATVPEGEDGIGWVWQKLATE
jgi:hypothetical protein